MLVNQVAVFLENKQGRISDFCATLSNAGINLITMSIADTTDFGILRAITDDNEKAIKALKDAGFTVSSTDLLGVEVEDKPGGLADVLYTMDNAGINIEYLYSFVKKDGKAMILFKVANIEETIAICKDKHLKIIDTGISIK